MSRSQDTAHQHIPVQPRLPDRESFALPAASRSLTLCGILQELYVRAEDNCQGLVKALNC